jgi:hypothetical protein
MTILIVEESYFCLSDSEKKKTKQKVVLKTNSKQNENAPV